MRLLQAGMEWIVIHELEKFILFLPHLALIARHNLLVMVDMFTRILFIGQVEGMGDESSACLPFYGLSMSPFIDLLISC